MKYRETVDFKSDVVDFGELLRLVRQSKGLTTRELSSMSGVTSAHICNLENKHTSATFITMSKLFRSMGYSIADAYAML